MSIAAGVAAITSAVTALRGYEVELCLALLVGIALANLRGVRESGRLFAPPTYTYIAMMTLLVVVGLIGVATGSLGRIPVDHKALEHFTGAHALLTGASAFLLLRAFSSGAVALSGVEAISNGIQAFRKPESRNAAITLVWVAVILGSLFLGIAVLASHLRPTLSPDQTILSIMGHEVFGDGVLYVLLQASTAAILTLSANTAFAGLPAALGDRRERRVPAATARQPWRPARALERDHRAHARRRRPSGRVRRRRQCADPVVRGRALHVVHPVASRNGRAPLAGPRTGLACRLAVNAVGALATAAVTIVVVVSKFTEGAWIPTLVIPLLVLMFSSIHRHYQRVDSELACPPGTPLPDIVHTVIVLVPDRIHLGVLESLAYAKTLRPHYLHAVHVAFDQESGERMLETWNVYGFDVACWTSCPRRIERSRGRSWSTSMRSTNGGSTTSSP